ncbi:uncharacterized protein METZ01_LOCUS170893 [marine metagenome]|uniref:Uncharacterized protein n=1 Tax=marine metagenome TaxID=408172 RepID=A0A382BWP4_9ZZZZ
MLYIVSYPDMIQWDYSIERQTQMTYLQMSGGLTGAGTRHNTILCKQSEVVDTLRQAQDFTHVMICSVGMIFVMTKIIKGWPVTAISDFKEFAKGKKYCKAHIIARPNNPAFLHHQHIELNLVKWRELDCPNIYDRWASYERSDRNYHDEYTPHWLIPQGLPKIDNFSHAQRSRKAFAYEHMHDEYQRDMWKDLREDNYDFSKPTENFYFSRLSENFNQRLDYYVENNELLGRLPSDKEIDVLFSPTGGFITEILAHKLNFNGKIIIYDHSQKILDIKKQILDTNPTLDELKLLENINPDINFIWNEEYQKGKVDTIAPYEEMRIWQEEMCENYDIDFWLMNLIEPDYNRLLKEVKGKKVFFNASNIFSFNRVILKYSLPEIYKSYYKFLEHLNQAESAWYRGTAPVKRWAFTESLKIKGLENEYVGQQIFNKPHGFGTKILNNEDKYVGEFKEGKYHGRGTYYFANNAKYVGGFKEGKFHGKGSVTLPDGKQYDGEWQEDKRIC